VENAPVGIGITTLDGQAIFRNRAIAEILGYSLEELLQQSVISRYLNPEDRGRFLKLARTGVVKNFEVQMRRKDDTAFWGSLTAIPQKTELGDGFITVLQDINERKQSEAKMKEMELKAQSVSRLASIGEMAAGIAHEINNPLTPALGYSEMLMKRDLPKDIKADLKVIHDSVRQAADVTKRLLTFARQVKPERNLTSINDIIETTLQLRAYRLTTSNIKVIREFDSKLPEIMADGAQLQQVFLNIIMDAEYEMIQAHKGGTLLIKTERVGDTIRVSVKDDGPGISKENMLKLFTPFFTTKKVGEGTGLGLSVCHGIISEHNGRIWAESEFGKGATFIIELPVITQVKEETVEAKLSEPDMGKALEAVKTSILVVDDEPSITKLLKRVLTEEGYEVKTTGKARAALRLIKSGKYALILLDIKLPNMSGIEMYEQLEKTDKSLVESIIFITGDVFGSGMMEFFSRTGVSYVSKPFNIEKLKEEVKSKLSLRR
jgi:PAS domain S-box-containing protein